MSCTRLTAGLQSATRSRGFCVLLAGMAALLWIGASPADACAQDFPPGGGGAGPLNPPTQQPQIPQQPGGQQGGGGQGGGQQGGPGGPVDLGGILDFEITPPEIEIENERIQPFVGPSRAAFETQGLAHPRSLIAPGSSGGGAGGGGGGGGPRITFRTPGAGGGAGGLGFGATSANQVVRAGLRARLVPQIEVRQPVSGEMVSTRFEQRLTRLPSVQSLANNVEVAIDGTTAVLTGTVSSQAERDRIERLARLEPGIYAIDNRIAVAGQ